MISALASTAFPAAPCTKVRKMSSIKGVRPQFLEPRDLSYNKFKRFSQIVSSSLPQNFGNIDPQTRDSALIKNSLSSTLVSVDKYIEKREIPIYSWANIANKLGAAYQFTRPFQIYGTILGIISISLVPVQAISDLSPTFFVQLFKTVISVALLYVYVNGLNEVTDVEIDKINKPFLPLVSGDLTLTEATAITSISIVTSFVIAVTLNSLPMWIAIVSIFFPLSAYSIDLPLLRWKKSAILTTSTLITLRAVVTPLCFFAHAQMCILGRPLMYTKSVFFTMAVMASFSAVISVFKDIPDVKGDKEHGVRSASILYGVDKVFWSCVYLLLATYGGAAIFGSTSTFLPTKIIGVLGHIIPAVVLWTRAKSTNISDPKATLSFYLFIWKLVYAEYLLIPFVR